MNKKIVTFGVALAVLGSFAIANVSSHANYNAGITGDSESSGDFVNSGETVTASMSGVGEGGGAAFAEDTSTNTFFAFVNTGGGAGQAYGATDSHSAPYSTSLFEHTDVSADTAGAYGTASVTVGW